MIECIFTIDYEIFGNGEGSLRELVYVPTERLMSIFQKRNVRFVSFVEAAELEMIEKHHSDSVINDVLQQICDLHRQGFEIGLHLHPQWYNARHDDGKWLLDYSEYNLCTLSRKRIDEIVQRSIDYLRAVLNTADYTPLAFRAGNWLLQPTETVASVLAEKGIKIDSSVFKGGLQRNHGLDYRPALKNGYFWGFQNDVNICDPNGGLIELPTYSVMVPAWKMLTRKRVGMQRTSHSSPERKGRRVNRYFDFLRFWYPLKFDFCRMTLSELISMVDKIIREDQENPELFRPIVAIGHTKDLTDFETVESFLSYLGKKGIRISKFEEIYPKCIRR